jgi:hypothetical protein
MGDDKPEHESRRVHRHGLYWRELILSVTQRTPVTVHISFPPSSPILSRPTMMVSCERSSSSGTSIYPMDYSNSSDGKDSRLATFDSCVQYDLILR